MPVPNEILSAIFLELDQHSLTVVSAVSQRFNDVAEYQLYASPSITDVLTDNEHVPHRTISWYQAMHRRRHLTSAVKRLQIRWQKETRTWVASDFLHQVCDQLSIVLRNLVALEQLDLWLGPANLVMNNSMHAIERVIMHCTLPQLRFCSLGADYIKGIQPYTTNLITFLSHAHNLRHFKLSDHHSALLNSSTTHVLPNLQTFRGSAAAAAALLPGRPVHHVSLIGQDSDCTQENLLRMTQTSVPLRSLDLSAISARPVLLRNVSLCMPGLERLRIKLALRHTLHYALSGIGLLAGLSGVLSAFPNLSHLDLSSTEGSRANPSEERTLCMEWSRGCPSLRTVIFPSQMEWVLVERMATWDMINNGA